MGGRKDRKVYGIGINDATYPLTRHEKFNGKDRIVWTCPYYIAWKDMLRRCYSELDLKRQPTYRGCSVCDE
jgi:hypothetical protein